MTQVSTRFPVLLAAFFAAASPAPAQVTAPQKASASASAPLPFDPAVTVGTLSNGMRYYIRENPKPEKRAELRLVVNAGSVLENEDQRGLAHMVEHMAFRGTKKFAGNQISSYLESVGMRYGPDINAFTSFDETVYEITIPTDTAAIVDKGRAHISWVWDVYDADKRRVLRIAGEEAGGRAGANAWTACRTSGSLFCSPAPDTASEFRLDSSRCSRRTSRRLCAASTIPGTALT